MKKKFYVTDYKLNTPYINSEHPINILIASDIHYHSGVNKDLFLNLLNYAKESKPNYIIMPGDQIETIDFIDNQNELLFFENFIKDLSKIAPIIMIPGNHEIQDLDIKHFKNRLNDNSYNDKAITYFEKLANNKNIYLLNNQTISIDNITFIGYSPRISTYQKINKQTENEFIEDFINGKFKISKNDYNILITHSPIHLYSETVQSQLKDFIKYTDLVITGHLHDGYLPKILDKKLGNTNVGLFVTPKVKPYPGIICRGMHDFGRGSLIISQGYRKWTANIPILNAFEKITANDVENITIERK